MRLLAAATRNDFSADFLVAGRILLLEGCEGNVRDFYLSNGVSY